MAVGRAHGRRAGGRPVLQALRRLAARDRARIDHDPGDDGILIRSTAAGGRLGGLAAATREAAAALAPAFDVVVVETVGVGQSETDVEEVCDTVAVVVQPGSGDTLQFLKAGIMEVPDVLVVTKADLGDVAMRARRDLAQALRALGSREVPVVAVSSVPPPSGIAELVEALDTHRQSLDLPAARLAARRRAAIAELVAEDGEGALRAVGGRREAERFLSSQDPAADVGALVSALGRRPGEAGRSGGAAAGRVRRSDLGGLGARCREPRHGDGDRPDRVRRHAGVAAAQALRRASAAASSSAVFTEVASLSSTVAG